MSSSNVVITEDSDIQIRFANPTFKEETELKVTREGKVSKFFYQRLPKGGFNEDCRRGLRSFIFLYILLISYRISWFQQLFGDFNILPSIIGALLCIVKPWQQVGVSTSFFFTTVIYSGIYSLLLFILVLTGFNIIAGIFTFYPLFFLIYMYAFKNKAVIQGLISAIVSIYHFTQ